MIASLMIISTGPLNGERALLVHRPDSLLLMFVLPALLGGFRLECARVLQPKRFGTQAMLTFAATVSATTTALVTPGAVEGDRPSPGQAA